MKNVTAPGKMTKSNKYIKTFQTKWLTDPVFGNWLEEKIGDGTKARCKICNIELRAHKSDLVKHQKTSKPISNGSSINLQPNITKSFRPIDTHTITKLELRLAVYVSCHSAINTIDHLTDMFKKEIKAINEYDNCYNNNNNHNNQAIVNLKLHRTKCSALIKNVISPSLLKEQINDLTTVKYSLILDESTDVSCAKHLCICIRYYNSRKNGIVTQFLGLIFVIETTAVVLYNHIKEFFMNIGLNLKNCFAIATDGGSNLCGCKHSVYTLMKKENKNLILVKCICHSLHLACSYASAKLPANSDYMLRESYNWFKRSAIKRHNYLKIFKLLNDGKEPLKLIQLSKTRWLARSNSVKRVLDQWDAIKIQFQLLNGDNNHQSTTEMNNNCQDDELSTPDISNESDEFKNDQDRYVVRELGKMFGDPANYLYFTFMSPILVELKDLNIQFQKDNSDHTYLLGELEDFALSLFGRVLYSSSVKLDVDFSFQSIYLPIHQVDFGFKFPRAAEEYIKKKIISEDSLHNVKLRCHEFLIKACTEVSKRLSSNREILHKIKNLSPTICLDPNRPPFKDLPLDLADPEDIPKIEYQWRKLLNMDFSQEFRGNIPTRGDTFWTKMITIKNSSGDLAFKEISMLTLTVYSLPISNATVERVFSRVTMIKTKVRSRMGLELLSSIIRIKMALEENGQCCINFEPNVDMLRYNSSIYNTHQSCDDEDELMSSLNF